jgi:hypothetical protein
LPGASRSPRSARAAAASGFGAPVMGSDPD